MILLVRGGAGLDDGMVEVRVELVRCLMDGGEREGMSEC